MLASFSVISGGPKMFIITSAKCPRRGAFHRSESAVSYVPGARPSCGGSKRKGLPRDRTMNSEPDLPADDPNALAAGIKAHLRWVQQRLREGIDEHEHERLLGERRYGPLDDPRDRGLASAWRAYEKVKQRCVETGCDPKHAPRIAWDFRPGSNQCAEIRCTTGRVKRIKVRWDKGRNNPPLYVPSRPRQPAARRRRPRKGLVS